jgi:hypothetical protein
MKLPSPTSKEAMQRQGVTLRAGDAVLIHTGWGKLWMKDNAKYIESEPGIGIPAAEWLAKVNPILVGSDNMGIEVVPHADKDLLFPVHQIMITTHGIFLLEITSKFCKICRGLLGIDFLLSRKGDDTEAEHQDNQGRGEKQLSLYLVASPMVSH